MRRLFASCFGLGRLPIAPGTWGSLPPTVIFAVMAYFGGTAVTVSIVMLVLVLAGSVACVRCSPVIIAATSKKDPGEVVADEFAGQAVTFLVLLALPTEPIQIAFVAAAGFLLFRLFDIVKPWPIRKLEKFPMGWGILADDLLAGVYAAVVLNICIWFWLVRTAGPA